MKLLNKSQKIINNLRYEGKTETIKIDYSKVFNAKPKRIFIPLWLRLQWRNFWYDYLQTVPNHLIRYGSKQNIGHYEFRWQRLFNIVFISFIVFMALQLL